jgi:hypothetical protein
VTTLVGIVRLEIDPDKKSKKEDLPPAPLTD